MIEEEKGRKEGRKQEREVGKRCVCGGVGLGLLDFPRIFSDLLC
jgi:hypothetical protein